MRLILISIGMLLALSSPAFSGQVRAGTPEDKLLLQITAETTGDEKLRLLQDFERRFPQSAVLPNVYLMVMDVYRTKDNRAGILEYGEKVLKLDPENLTALMAVARNYAIERRDLDRAVDLAQKAVGLVDKHRRGAKPSQHTDSQWTDYLANTDSAARAILEYALSIRGHAALTNATAQ